METMILLLTIVCILGALMVIVMLIRLLQKLTRTVEDTSITVQEFRALLSTLQKELPTFLQEWRDLFNQAKQSISHVEGKLSLLGDTLENFRQISQRINNLEQRLQDKIEGPLLDAARVVAGVTKAIKTFADSFNRR